MEYVCIGKIVNTHGIKGELRILSDFEKKDKAFIIGMTLFIGKGKNPEIIASYRKHKCFDMITLQGYNNINEVLKYKNELIYVTRESLALSANEYLYQDLIGLNIYDSNKNMGIVKEIVYNKSNILLSISGDKNFFIPLNEVFVKKVDLDKKIIEVQNVKGLML